MKTKILIVGLGQIGTANLGYINSLQNPNLSLNVHDIKYKDDAYWINGACYQKSFKDFDIFMIDVSTHNPKRMGEPSLVAVTETINRVHKQGKKGSLVCLESTIPLGTSTWLGGILHERGIHLVHVPERFYGPEKNKGHGINQVRVFGYCQDCCLKPGLRFYQSILRIPVHIVPDIRLAEASKIVENTNRYVKIALVEEHYLWAKEEGLDADLLIEAINTKWNSDKLYPLNGIKGHCLPKDTLMYIDDKTKKYLITEAAIKTNKKYEKHLQDTLTHIFEKNDQQSQ